MIQADRCDEPRADSAPAARARHVVILAGRTGVFYDGSGPVFAMAIDAAGDPLHVDAVGIHAVNGRPVFGAVPPAVYLDLAREPHDSSSVLLRIAITPADYHRAVAILRRWERRVREGALLYPEIAMNNILLVKQVTESLNACGERVTPYTLDWGVADHISEHTIASLIPFRYFTELRRLNEARHLRDSAMPPLQE